MSADEESFIVLDETPSMLQYSILDSSPLTNDSIKDCEQTVNSASNSVPANDVWRKDPIQTNGLSCSIGLPSTSSIQCNGNLNNATADLAQISLPNSEFSPQTSLKSNSVPSLTQSASPNNHNAQPPKATLAQSFLLGAIDCDTMKCNVKSYFPSLGNSTNQEDIEKLQSLIQERNELKDTLQRTNVTMRQQFSLVNNWHTNVKALRESHEIELNKSKNINDELFKQNRDLQEKVDELQQLAELSRRQQEQTQLKKCETDRSEVEVRELKMQLAKAIAKNVELDEIQKESSEKLERLQIDWVANQTLYKNAVEEIQKLKMQNEGLKQELNQTKAELEKCRVEMDVVQQQCHVYQSDFELERKARQEMAGERDQMFADIKMLKKRNQALVDEAQSYYSETSAASLTSNGIADMSVNSIEDNEQAPKAYVLTCPLCSTIYERLNDLESHVQNCLEKTERN